MTLIEALKSLLALKQPALQTQDVSACLKITTTHASKVLERLEKADMVKKVSRGKWMFSDVKDPLILPEFLTAPYPSYISLQTALYHHGMISQIPAATYAVSLARTRQHATPLGIISIHHIQVEFFFGFDVYKHTFIKMASPEKALLDVLYLAGTKSRLFKKLPEIEIPKKFNIDLAHKMINKIPTKRRFIVKRSLDNLIESRRH